jgi:PAS domain S-box-containing protein
VNERKDGTQFVAKHTIAPVMDDSGAVTHFVAIYDDITERKERERRLQTHELVVQTMNEEAFLVDNQRRIRFANDAALDFVGASRAEIEGQPIGSVIEGMAAPDEEPQRFLNAIDSLLDDVEPDVGEWVRESDGTKALSLEFDFYVESIGEVYAEQRLVPVEFYDGERGVAVISRDITKRREREQEIQTHLVQAQEIGHVGSWYLNLGANERQWSDECYRIFGLEPGTPMTYERFLDMVHPEDREQVDEVWDSALKDGSYDIEHRIVVDGETRWVQETAEIEFDANGEPESGIGVVRDITDQVQRTREIRAQKRRYESLFNNVSGAIVVTDLDGHIRTCNPGFTDLFGYDSDRVRGDHLGTITGDDADVERLLETAAVSQGPRIVTYRKNSGQVFPGESRSSPLRTHDDVTGRIIHISDVSERRRNRKQLQVLGRLLRHNVKNDMNVIMGLAERIKAHGSNVVTPHAEKILEKSRTFVGRAENQQRITELLTGRAETNRLDLVPVVKTVVSDVQQQHPDATLEADLAADCPTITTHEIKEAIRELVENAVVHSEQESPSVNIQLRCTDGITELKIRDDGPGIPEQEWKVLTEEGEINPLHHGTGLGLWFVNEVVRHSNGTLSFDGNDSRGSTVAVRLPAG